MHDPLLVGGLQRARDLDRDAEGFLADQRAAVQALRQRLPFEALEDQEIDVRLGAHVVQHADVGVIEGGDGPGLPLEAMAPGRIGREAGWEDLEGDGATQARVPPFVNLAHAPGPDEAEDLVPSEPRAGCESHGQSGGWRSLDYRPERREARPKGVES